MIKLKALITEGVYDPGIFKAIFLAGGPGSGKSFIVDRVGTGDSFTAGIIHGLLNHRNDFQYVIDLASALSALNHTTRGDTSEFNLEEVEQVMKSGSSGIIIR